MGVNGVVFFGLPTDFKGDETTFDGEVTGVMFGLTASLITREHFVFLNL